MYIRAANLQKWKSVLTRLKISNFGKKSVISYAALWINKKKTQKKQQPKNATTLWDVVHTCCNHLCHIHTCTACHVNCTGISNRGGNFYILPSSHSHAAQSQWSSYTKSLSVHRRFLLFWVHNVHVKHYVGIRAVSKVHFWYTCTRWGDSQLDLTRPLSLVRESGARIHVRSAITGTGHRRAR